MSSLGQKKNLVPTLQKDNFAYMLRLFGGKPIRIDLSYQNLSECDLTGIDFTESTISYGVYNNSVMRSCRFSEITNVKMWGTRLDDCHIRGRIIDSEFTEANFNFATFFDAYFKRNVIKASTFGGSFWYTCQFKENKFEHCRIFHSVFSNCQNTPQNIGLLECIEDEVLFNGEALRNEKFPSKSLSRNVRKK